VLPRVLVEKISAFALAKQIGLIGMWQKIYLKIELLIHLKPLPDLDLPAPQKHRSEPPKDASSTAQLGFLIVDLHLAAEREKNICEMSQKNHLPQEITRPIFRRSVFPSLSWMAIPWKLSNENGWT